MRGKVMLQLIAVLSIVGLAACNGTATNSTENTTSTSSSAPPPSAAPPTPAGPLSITSEPFGRLGADAVSRYTLTNGHGMRVRILNYGGIIQSIEVPDRAGTLNNAVLGFPPLEAHPNNPGSAKTYFGAIIARYGNRIAKGTFSLNGAEYHLPINNNGNSLHGGTAGFDSKVWQATTQN